MSKRLQVYEHANLRVTFDPNRCIHAAECIRALPDVFDSRARPWIAPEKADAESVIAAVHRCPTGALHIERDGAVVEVGPEISVRAVRHGPLYVRGEARVTGSDGNELLSDRRFALCRCGHSSRKPFCDGSHRENGFRDPA